MSTAAIDFLTLSLQTYWFAPPVALWRAVELRTAARETYPRPLLDLGCGDGLIAGLLFGPQGVDIGLDPWAEQVQRAARSGVYRWVQRADGARMPYRDGTFVTVFSNSVLEHIPNIGPVLAEVGRVLRTGGRFIFTVPSDAFRRMLYYYRRRMDAGDEGGADAYADEVDRRLAHHHYHTPEEWESLLARAGMTLEKARYYIPEPVEHLWDRMNHRFGIGRRSLWGMLVSPRLRPMGYQRLLARWVVRHFSRAWRPWYEMEVPQGAKGGGLLIVAQKG